MRPRHRRGVPAQRDRTCRTGARSCRRRTSAGRPEGYQRSLAPSLRSQVPPAANAAQACGGEVRTRRRRPLLRRIPGQYLRRNVRHRTRCRVRCGIRAGVSRDPPNEFPSAFPAGFPTEFPVGFPTVFPSAGWRGRLRKSASLVALCVRSGVALSSLTDLRMRTSAAVLRGICDRRVGHATPVVGPQPRTLTLSG